jgi:hypothetical protein
VKGETGTATGRIVCEGPPLSFQDIPEEDK